MFLDGQFSDAAQGNTTSLGSNKAYGVGWDITLCTIQCIHSVRAIPVEEFLRYAFLLELETLFVCCNNMYLYMNPCSGFYVTRSGCTCNPRRGSINNIDSLSGTDLQPNCLFEL